MVAASKSFGETRIEYPMTLQLLSGILLKKRKENE